MANIWTNLYREHGSKVIGEVTLDQAYGGARGVKCLVWEVGDDNGCGCDGKRSQLTYLLRDPSWMPRKVFVSEERP